MIDFNKKIIDSNKFREPAITFEQTGKYCNYASNTSEYFSYWDEQKRRCLEGYTAEDGDWISGYNYFYLNFCPINRSINKKIKDRHGKDKIVTVQEVAFPDFWDYDYFYFQTIQDAEESGKHLCVLKSRRKGYEQPYSEEVLTPNGFVQMGSLKVGDMVMNPNGSPVRIGDIVEQGIQEVYEVEFQDGRVVRCGANHLWATCRNGKKFYIMPTKEYAKRKLTQGSKGKEHYPYKVPAINPLRFDEKPIHIDPYVLGILLGDGYICGSQVRFSTADQFIVEELSRRLPDYIIKKIESDKYAYAIISKDKKHNNLNRELKKLGIKVKANKKFIPENYKYTSVENRFELVRGLMDTDGSVTNGASTFVSTSEQLIDDLQFVLRSLGIRCHKSKEIEGRFGVEFNNGCKSNTLSHWELCITTQEDIFKLPRKLEKIRKDRKYNYNGIGIKAIRRTGKFEKQRCLCIDNENHLYITKDFIPTHNSYKGGSMLCRNYYLIPNSKSYVYASNKQYLTDDGILTKAWDYMDFIDKNTAWGKKRSVNTAMRKRAGFFTKDEFGNEVELGYKSEIIGVTLKDNPDIVRGKKAKLILFEEAGSFKELGAAWQIARPSVEVDGVAFGTMIAFGCVCKGSRVWTSDGNCINIENLKQEDGIIGWDTYQASIQNIENINPISQKECVQIELQSGRTIRCSKDHPLLWSTPGRTKRVSGKRFENERMKSWLWHEAQKCKIGDQVGLIDQIPVFGKNVMWEPRFIGWLIGDGSYGNNKTPILSNCEQEILDYVHSHFDTVIEKQYTTKDNKNYQEIRIKGIRKQLRKLGIYGQTKGNKRLPIDFNSYDEYTISELIGGLYDTDGYIHFSKKRARIVLTQCQKDILLQVQEALLHFGIHGIIRYIKPTNRIRKYKDHFISDKNGEYRLEIADVVSLGRFSQHIKLTVSRKSAALDLIYLFIQSELPKYNKYLCGIVADKITNITDIGIQDIYNITAKEQHNYIVNGIVTHNTGGDEESNFATLKDMFYKPKGYNCVELQNIWDENAVTSTCGFFIPQYANMDIRDDKGNRIYMDDDGNTLRKPSLDFILEQRKEMIQNATNSVAVDRYVCERCITPAEACLEFGGNIFPKKELQEQLARIRTNKQLQNHKQIGDLVQTPDGNISWVIKKTGDITHYPLNKDDDPTGSIVIWEHPMKDAPFGLYIAGIDPYDHDQSGTNSLGSCIIYKRIQNIESYSDIIVAEYTGRPQAADDFYENVRKLLIYYNARAMYENQNKGLFVYFANKHCDYLLADQPDIINDIVGNSKVQRKKGCHMNKSIKAWGEGLIKDWLNDINADGKKNLYNILSEPLLEELIAYNDIINTDRVMALMQVMIYREQLFNIVVKEKEKENKSRLLFDGPIFAQNWFDDESPVKFDDDNVYTFTN